ncbi:MAG: tRNA (guanosine(37)-N1)-methyltransferase TrmD [Bdellovibrionales bacterium]|nr:tRNA (guanosine(37)-N1)-methyltransferase TrmD [Bdellovibrionales bacterium]
MKFNVITLMPDLVKNTLSQGVVGSAFNKNICELELVNPREFTDDVHQTVDDRPFGGGDGMLMMVAPLEKSLSSLNLESNEEVYYLSPQGPRFNDAMATEISQKKEVTLICGRYGGVDQRFLAKNNIKEVSIGDYVLSGGELASAVIIDAVARKIPGVLGHVASASQDSFSDDLLEAPYFTRPRNYQDWEVPEILLSGDHKKVEEYRELMSYLVTLQKRPELVENKKVPWDKLESLLANMSDEDIKVSGLDKQALLKIITKEKS